MLIGGRSKLNAYRAVGGPSFPATDNIMRVIRRFVHSTKVGRICAVSFTTSVQEAAESDCPPRRPSPRQYAHKSTGHVCASSTLPSSGFIDLRRLFASRRPPRLRQPVRHG